MKDFYKPLYIADASVILKWFIKENNRTEALKLKQDFLNNKIELGIPTLAYYEVNNYTVRTKPMEALFFLSQLFMLQMIEFGITLENSSKSMEITGKFAKISFYDAAYHALAIQNNGTFITADENYYKKAKSLKHIRLLKNYK